jgi:hypothetical protein
MTKMTSLEQCINEACKNDYRLNPKDLVLPLDAQYLFALFDPLFWQTLGRGLGWKDRVAKRGLVEWSGQIKPNDVNGPAEYDTYFEAISEPEWKYMHHRLIDWIDDGKSVEDYFKEIISNK